MFRSLYGKLALALLAVLGIIGVLYILVTLVTTRLFLQEVNQNLDRDVAQHIVSETPLLEDGQVQQDALEDVFHMMMVVNPSIEIYLLDSEGRILGYSAPPSWNTAGFSSPAPSRKPTRPRSSLESAWSTRM